MGSTGKPPTYDMSHPSPPPDVPAVSIILVNYNGAHLLRNCLRSVYERTKEIMYEIVVVDNSSIDESRSLIRSEFPRVRLVESDENLGFSKGNNLGARTARGRDLLFLNTDTILIDNSVKILADFLAAHPDAGCVGPKMIFEDRSFQLSAGRLPTIFVEALDMVRYAIARKWRRLTAPVFERLQARTTSVGWVTGACMMVRRTAFDQAGGFDPEMFMYFEDKDLCHRLAHDGWRVMYNPSTSVIHLMAGSSGREGKAAIRRLYRTSQTHYYNKHLGAFQCALLRMYLGILGER